MPHASTYALIPNFSAPADGAPERVPFHADAVFAAIDAHNEAWAVLQVAPEGGPGLRAEEAHGDALDALLGTPCATRAGAFVLLSHLRWFLREEAGNAEGYGVSWPVVQAREADLTLLLCCDGIDRIPPALPSGRLPAPRLVSPAPAAVPAPIPAPQPTPAHYGRLLALGEALGALVLVAGGCLVTGLATLV